MSLQTKNSCSYATFHFKFVELKDFYKVTNFITTFIQLLFYSTIVLLNFGLWPNYSLKILKFSQESILLVFSQSYELLNFPH
jgi:hypothetical protein